MHINSRENAGDDRNFVEKEENTRGIVVDCNDPMNEIFFSDSIKFRTMFQFFSFNSTYSFSHSLNTILFLIITSISILSISINLFALRQLHANTKLSVFVFRTILHVSLFTTCTCIPFFLLELYYDSYFPLPPWLCTLWLIVDYSSTVCLGLLVFWASIQRHILIFGPIHLKKLQSTIPFKLIPNILALILPLIWYSTLASICTYEKSVNETFKCRPCFENDKSIFLIDTILSFIVPLFLTILVTFGLLVRIIRLRFRTLHLPSRKWRRCKRLTRQMILFSFIYLIGLVPYVLINLNSLYNFWPWMDLPWCIQLANAFTYVPCCFSPFLSIYAFPEICTNQRNRRRRRHRHHIKANRKHQRISINTSEKSSLTIFIHPVQM